MAVVLDAVGPSVLQATAATGITGNSWLTVGTGSNRALIVTATWDANPGNHSVIWDNAGSSQTMTELVAFNNGTLYVSIFGLLAPVSGQKQLALFWVNSCNAGVDGVSLLNVNQTGGSSSFYGATTNSGSGLSTSMTVASSPNDYVVEAIANGGTNGLSGSSTTTELYHIATGLGGGSSYGTGKSSHSVIWLNKVSSPWADAAISVAGIKTNPTFNMAGF